MEFVAELAFQIEVGYILEVSDTNYSVYNQGAHVGDWRCTHLYVHIKYVCTRRFIDAYVIS